jgi:hypothetical protein
MFATLAKQDSVNRLHGSVAVLDGARNHGGLASSLRFRRTVRHGHQPFAATYVANVF